MKSKVYGIDVTNDQVEHVANGMGCMPGNLPFIYLGMPIGCNMRRKENRKVIIDKFEKRLTDWKAKTISFGGRLTLVKAVLGSMSLYHFSLFHAPMSVINNIERVRSQFFWGEWVDGGESRKIARVKWERILNSFEEGGLNVGSLQAFNLGLLGKWWWRF